MPATKRTLVLSAAMLLLSALACATFRAPGTPAPTRPPDIVTPTITQTSTATLTSTPAPTTTSTPTAIRTVTTAPSFTPSPEATRRAATRPAASPSTSTSPATPIVVPGAS